MQVGVGGTVDVGVGGIVGIAVGAPPVGVGAGDRGSRPVTISPSVHVVASALPSGVARAGIAAPQWQRIDRYVGRNGEPARVQRGSGAIGSLLLNESTMARTPVHDSPGMQLGGWNPKLVASLRMAGLTAQSGRPLVLTTTAAPDGNSMSFCVPATSLPAARDTATSTVSPGKPDTSPIVSDTPVSERVAVAVTVAPGVIGLLGGRVPVAVGVEPSLVASRSAGLVRWR